MSFLNEKPPNRLDMCVKRLTFIIGIQIQRKVKNVLIINKIVYVHTFSK